MIKCPYCGSTAQVKINAVAILSINERYLDLGCECGCGCSFNASYNIDDYESADIITIEKRGN